MNKKQGKFGEKVRTIRCFEKIAEKKGVIEK